MIIIHHNKDMDGYCSGAICKLKYPDAKLIGWDYKDPIPDFEEFKGEDVIMIDITFPLNKLNELSNICKTLTVIDHHISFAKEFKAYHIISDAQFNPLDSELAVFGEDDSNFRYVYQNRRAACEVGWKYLFPDKDIPYAVTLIGRYDTWRQEEGDWQGETLPFKYCMYGMCNSAETFPTGLFYYDDAKIAPYLEIGKSIMKYENTMNESVCRSYSFEREAYGLKAICINAPYFSSEVVKSVYNADIHDIMVGFCFSQGEWTVSLRSAKPEVDVSIIAKARGGGGHKGAAGFKVKNFEDIFV